MLNVSTRDKPDKSVHEGSIEMLIESVNPREVLGDEFRLEIIQSTQPDESPNTSPKNLFPGLHISLP